VMRDLPILVGDTCAYGASRHEEVGDAGTESG